MSEPRRLSVLLVCTGNICRSPAAERLLATVLDSSANFSSAGTQALVGQAIARPMQQLLEGVGVDSQNFAARQLTVAQIQRADLVLALTRAHRSTVVLTCPAAVRRTFTLPEFARTIAALPSPVQHAEATSRLAACISLAAAHRVRLSPARSGEDDVPDPFGKPDAHYKVSFDGIRRAVDTMATALLKWGPCW